METVPWTRDAGQREAVGNPLLQEALKYAARGWLVLPLHNPIPSGCSCRKPNCNSTGKHPRTSAGLRDASADATIIQSWWERWPEANIGVATGPHSGIFVLDVDGEPGIAALYASDRLGHELPETLTSSTGRGSHIYFRWPEGRSVRNSAGTLAKGLDIRGEGGYVVAPPSIHAGGTEYIYADAGVPIANAPQWLLAKTASEIHPVHQRASILRDGQRNDGLARLAGALRRKGATKSELERQLLAENRNRCRPPLEDKKEVFRIAASIARYPVGGPDILERAWNKVKGEHHASTYQRFLALARHLQLARPGFPVALPLERIGKLMEFNWTLIRRYRKRAEKEGFIVEVRKAVRKKLAAHFLIPNPSETGVPLAGAPVPLKELIKA